MRSTRRPRPAVIFVHGFGSSAASWDPLLELLRQDDAVTSRFELACFEYPTQWLSFNPLRRIPRLREVSEKLRAFIDSPDFYDRELTLVGHSQGGLVIQGYLACLLQEGLGDKLALVRQVILMATPNHGSTLLSPLRRFLTALVPNPQERTLRALDPDIADTRSVIQSRVIRATEASAAAYPIPVHAFYGLRDNVVPEASARGDFDVTTPLDGDHFSIVKPASHDDDRYREFVEALVDPSGHAHVFEVDSYDTTLRIEPLPGMQEVPVTHGRTSRTVETDHVGTLTCSATFSRRNRCRDPFTMRYLTREGGYLQPAMSHANEASLEDRERYDDYGTEVVFRFVPRNTKEEYALQLGIYGGFGRGNRSLHLHLQRHSYYKRLSYTVDLRPFVRAGYSVTQVPLLCFHETDLEDCAGCGVRGLGAALEPTSIGEGGIWRWELESVRQGVVDFVWDVSPSPASVFEATRPLASEDPVYAYL